MRTRAESCGKLPRRRSFGSARLGVLLLLPLWCQAVTLEATLKTKGNAISFSNGRIELRFSKDTGRWLSLYDASDGRELLDAGDRLPPVMLIVGGRTTVTTGQQQVWSLADTDSVGAATKLVSWRKKQTDDLSWLELETAQGDWRIWQYYGFDPKGDTVRRRVRIIWRGQGEQLLRWVEFRTPGVTRLQQTILAAPGYNVLYQPADRLPMGRWPALSEEPGIDAPAWRLGIVAMQEENSTVLIWPFSAQMPSIMLVDRDDWGVGVIQRLLAATRLESGQELEVGTQFIRLRPGAILEAVKDFSEFWDEVGIRLQGGTPDWAQNARIYEVQIGSHARTRNTSFKPYETAADLTSDLPRIAKLGFNIVQLMPHMPFPSYAVHDYFDLNTQYAPEADLRRMIERAHELGMKVLLDVVLHGVTDKSINSQAIFDKHPLLTKHPGWFSYNEYGEVARTYTWAFDHSNPAVQQYMVKVFNFYMAKLRVDGFRVDAVTWNCFPNWAKNLPRPGYSSLYGTASMMDLVREQARQINPEAVFYNEAAGPLYYRSFDLSYNYDEQWLYGAAMSGPRRKPPSSGEWSEPGLSARDLGEWLEMRRRVMPRGLIRVHHVDSHDAFYPSGKYRREMFGDAGARLLFAFASFIDGGVMSFMGGETGSEEFYRRVLALRESLPALKMGICDYLAVQPGNDRVFAPLRRHGADWALPLLSFSKEAITTDVPLKALNLDPNTTYILHESFSGMERTGKGAELATLKVDLPPLGAQLWVPRRPK